MKKAYSLWRLIILAKSSGMLPERLLLCKYLKRIGLTKKAVRTSRVNM
jgi:hypothetical protein